MNGMDRETEEAIIGRCRSFEVEFERGLRPEDKEYYEAQLRARLM
jgi:hypothetical protein